jgi:hypothetical protein
MNDLVPHLVEQYRTSGILIDTNLLLLWFIGTFTPKLIPLFKRTKQFNADDHELLLTFIEPFKNIVTTPHILTEVNSLSNQLPNHLKPAYHTSTVPLYAHLSEVHIPAVSIITNSNVHEYGLTDIGIFLIAKDRYLVLTDDLRLSIFLATHGVDAINFNHLRQWFDD